MCGSKEGRHQQNCIYTRQRHSIHRVIFCVPSEARCTYSMLPGAQNAWGVAGYYQVHQLHCTRCTQAAPASCLGHARYFAPCCQVQPGDSTTLHLTSSGVLSRSLRLYQATLEGLHVPPHELYLQLWLFDMVILYSFWSISVLFTCVFPPHYTGHIYDCEVLYHLNDCWD